jgi:hypothetical protein
MEQWWNDDDKGQPTSSRTLLQLHERDLIFFISIVPVGVCQLCVENNRLHPTNIKIINASQAYVHQFKNLKTKLNNYVEFL